MGGGPKFFTDTCLLSLVMVILDREFSPIIRGTLTIQVDDLYDSLSGGLV